MRFYRRWKYTIRVALLLLVIATYVIVRYSQGCEIVHDFGRRNHWEC